jgi:hypothetical protein
MGGLTSGFTGQVLFNNKAVIAPPTGVAFVFQDYTKRALTVAICC